MKYVKDCINKVHSGTWLALIQWPLPSCAGYTSLLQHPVKYFRYRFSVLLHWFDSFPHSPEYMFTASDCSKAISKYVWTGVHEPRVTFMNHMQQHFRSQTDKRHLSHPLILNLPTVRATYSTNLLIVWLTYTNLYTIPMITIFDTWFPNDLLIL